MNMIDRWADMINEEYKSDSYKQDDLEIAAAKWEQFKKDMEDLENEMSLKDTQKNEAEETEQEDGEDIDPEIKKLGAIADKTVDDLTAASERNARKVDGLSDDDDKKEVQNEQKKWYVYHRAEVFKPANTKKDVEDADTIDAFAALKKGTKELDVFVTKEFYTEHEAKSYVSEQIRDLGKKYGVGLEDFQVIGLKEKVTRVYKQSKDSEQTEREQEINGIPTVIKRADPGAFGFLHIATDGKGQKWQRGPKSDGNYTFDKIEAIKFFEFIIYKAKHPVPFDGGISELYNAFMEINFPGWKSYKDKEREEYNNALKGMAAMQQELNAARKTMYANKTERLIALSDDDDKLITVLKTVFPDKSDEDLLNTTAEDLEELNMFKLRKVYWALGGKDDDEVEDEEYSGSADDYAKNGEDVDLATDDEILAAASKDGYETVAQRNARRHREKDEFKDDSEDWGKGNRFAYNGDDDGDGNVYEKEEDETKQPVESPSETKEDDEPNDDENKKNDTKSEK